MYWRYWCTDLWLNIGWALAHWRRRLALFWYGGEKAPWLFVGFAALIAAALMFALYSAIAYQDERRVYGREGEPCQSCGARIRRIVIGQRSAHYCPRCQS